jgi:uncharacterized protein YecT (DUF1311 family)
MPRLPLLIAGSMVLSWACSGTAAAIECAKAQSGLETLACSRPVLRDLDNRMAAAYATAREGLGNDRKAVLLANQRNWLRRREQVCAIDLGGADTAASCFADRTAMRLRTLTAAKGGAGVPALAPALIEQRGGKGAFTVTIEYPQIATPETAAQKALNTALKRAAEGDRLWAQKDEDDATNDDLAYEATYDVAFASKYLVSVAFEIYVDDGGAHPNSTTAMVNFDLDRGREIQLGDVLNPDGLPALARFCVDQMKKNRADEDTSEVTEDNVTEVMKSLRSWIVEADRVRVQFDPYTIGSYSQGFFECAIPYTAMAPYRKPSAPLPPRS